MDDAVYEIYAIKYAHHDRMARENFIGGDPHDGPMPMDDFVWVIRNATRTLVVASDATHSYANLHRGVAYPIVFHVGDKFDGYATVRRLATSDAHIIPGHDPQVLSLYPPAHPDTAGWIVRLDLPPRGDPVI